MLSTLSKNTSGYCFSTVFYQTLHCILYDKSELPSLYPQGFKGLVHPKMKIMSVCTHPHVVPNLYVFICSAEHKGRYLEECFNQTDIIPH